MSRNSFFALLITIIIVGCSSKTMTILAEFPLQKGTAWVYSYQAYQPSISDPTQIAKAVYQLTEIVADTESGSPYFVAHIKSEWKLIQADSGWTEDFVSGQPDERWYVVNGRKVFESRQAVDVKNANPDNLILDYDFPLAMNKKWCSMQFNPKDPAHTPITSCQYSGEREITNQSTFETSTGKFKDCYDMVDYFNDGNFYQKFCNGVGVVSLKYDHAGTRFGFEQTLTHYTAGAP